MNPADLVALLAYAAAMTFSPGPNTALSTAIASRHGLPAAMRFVLGVPVGWCLLIAISAAGLAVGLSPTPAVRTALLLAAVIYVLWLAQRLWRQARLAEADASRLEVGFLQGIVLQFVNGKAWLSAVTVSATWVVVGQDLAPRLAWVLPVMMAFAFASNFAYALVGASLRAWLSTGRRLVVFNRGLAVLLMLTAGWMAWSAGLRT